MVDIPDIRLDDVDQYKMVVVQTMETIYVK